MANVKNKNAVYPHLPFPIKNAIEKIAISKHLRGVAELHIVLDATQKKEVHEANKNKTLAALSFIALAVVGGAAKGEAYNLQHGGLLMAIAEQASKDKSVKFEDGRIALYSAKVPSAPVKTSIEARLHNVAPKTEKATPAEDKPVEDKPKKGRKKAEQSEAEQPEVASELDGLE